MWQFVIRSLLKMSRLSSSLYLLLRQTMFGDWGLSRLLSAAWTISVKSN